VKGRKQPVALYTPYPPLPPPPVHRTFDNHSGRNSPSSQSPLSARTPTNTKSNFHSKNNGSGSSGNVAGIELQHDPSGEHFRIALSTQLARIAAASLAALLRFTDLGYQRQRRQLRNYHQPQPQQTSLPPRNTSHTRFRGAASAMNRTLDALNEHTEHESRTRNGDAETKPAATAASDSAIAIETALASESKAAVLLPAASEGANFLGRNASGMLRSLSSSSYRPSQRQFLVLGSFDFEGGGGLGSFTSGNSGGSGGDIGGSIDYGTGGGISGSMDFGYATRRSIVNLDAYTSDNGADEVAIAAEAAVSGGHSAASFLATVAGQKLLEKMASRTHSSGENFSRMSSSGDSGTYFESQQAVSSWQDDAPSIEDPRQFWRDVSKSVNRRRSEANRARLALHQGRDYRGDTPGVYPKGRV